jgi:poly-beta-1,6-N-acetyl-D-glucosamine biosynthesis protein PgaD
VRIVADDLIINARRKLGWRRRIGSDVATAILWIVWIYLWWPVIEKARQVVRLRLGFEPAAIEVLETAEPIPLKHSLVALLGTCLLLLLWTLLPKRQLTRTHAEATLADCAQAFGLPAEVIANARQNRVTTVHYDDEGSVVQLDAGSPGAPALRG